MPPAACGRGLLLVRQKCNNPISSIDPGGPMAYADKLTGFREKMDPQGALDFLESIFKAEAQIFAQVVDGFQPQMNLDEKVEYLRDRLQESEDDADALFMLFKPFNALVFRIGGHERRNALVTSGHYDPASARFERFYGLNHQIIFEADSREDLALVNELKEGKRYHLRKDGEALTGKQLYHDLKESLFSRHLAELAEGLLAAEWFAERPKGLPFYFLIQGAKKQGQTRIRPLRVFSEKETCIEQTDEGLRATFKSFIDAFILRADFTGAIELLSRIADNLDSKKPGFSLLMSNLATMFLHSGQQKQAEAVFDRLFAADASRIDPAISKDFAQARFNQACLFATTNRPDQAMQSLRKAVALGHYSSERILAESDFESLRKRDDFQELIGFLLSNRPDS
jgi:tetratricopeptide (TPR) repeat protein